MYRETCFLKGSRLVEGKRLPLNGAAPGLLLGYRLVVLENPLDLACLSVDVDSPEGRIGSGTGHQVDVTGHGNDKPGSAIQ